MTPVATSAQRVAAAFDGIVPNHEKKSAAPSKQAAQQEINGGSKKQTEIPLVDLYSGSSDSIDADSALRQAIIDGLLGAKNPIVPGDVDSPGELAIIV